MLLYDIVSAYVRYSLIYYVFACLWEHTFPCSFTWFLRCSALRTYVLHFLRSPVVALAALGRPNRGSRRDSPFGVTDFSRGSPLDFTTYGCVVPSEADYIKLGARRVARR